MQVRDFLGTNFVVNQGQGSDLCTPIPTPAAVPNPPFTSAAQVGSTLDCQVPGGTTSFTLTAQVVANPTAGAVPQGANAACLFADLARCAVATTTASQTGVTKSVVLVNGAAPIGTPPTVHPGDVVTFRIAFTGAPSGGGTFNLRDFLGANFVVNQGQGASFCSTIFPPPPAPAAIPAVFGGTANVGTVLDCQVPAGTTQFDPQRKWYLCPRRADRAARR